MVANSGFVKPTNKITVQGKPEWITRQAEEAGIKPGMVVMTGTTQDLIKIGTYAKGPMGFAGYEQAPEPNFDTTNIYGRNKPEGLTAAYAVGAKVPVLYLANFVILAWMDAASACQKGDLLACLSGGKLVAGKMTKDGFAIKLPFTKNTTEVSTGLVIPAGAVVNDVFIEVTTNVAGSSIDVGLAEVTGAETGGDADGFLDGESCVNAGRVQHVQFDASAANNTLGAFLVAGDIKTADTTPLYFSVPKRHVGDGVAKTVTYTTSNHTIAGNIFVVIESLEPIAKSVEYAAAGERVLVEALI